MSLLKNHRVFILAAVIFLILASLLYTRSGKVTEESLSEQVLYRKQTIARAGAKSIESFLRLTGNSLVLLASDSTVVSGSSKSQGVLEESISD